MRRVKLTMWIDVEEGVHPDIDWDWPTLLDLPDANMVKVVWADEVKLTDDNKSSYE